MENWKETYEEYVSHWQAESKEAREKALKTREKLEKELDEREKSESGRGSAEKKEKERQAKAKADAERLRRELGEQVEAAGARSSSTDPRGVMDADYDAGQAILAGQSRPSVKQVSEKFSGILLSSLMFHRRPHTILRRLTSPCHRP